MKVASASTDREDNAVMDGQRFDHITKTMASGASRRRVLGGLAAAVAGAAGLRSVSTIGLAAPEDVCPGTHLFPPDDTTKSIKICASGDLCITGYCVKAGSANQGDGPESSELDPPKPCVTISHSTEKDISHYSYSEGPCPEEPPTPKAQWCSPGYWKQKQHLGSWAATGISPDEKYNNYFNPNLDGNPTLLQVLRSPQTYGGGATNKVADLLSKNHPDVNFTGKRVEDSCPLGRNEG
jgi:hypothetical protein